MRVLVFHECGDPNGGSNHCRVCKKYFRTTLYILLENVNHTVVASGDLFYHTKCESDIVHQLNYGRESSKVPNGPPLLLHEKVRIDVPGYHNADGNYGHVGEHRGQTKFIVPIVNRLPEHLWKKSGKENHNDVHEKYGGQKEPPVFIGHVITDIGDWNVLHLLLYSFIKIRMYNRMAAPVAGRLAVHRLSSEYPGIDTCPLIYCSTHGSYVMSYYKESGGPFDFITKVPENTILIEYSGPDDVCYFMNVKDTLEKILRNREDLLSWLYGIALPGKYFPGEASRIAKCLDACHIYLPGSDICNRVLTLVGGLQRNSSDKVKGSARLSVERNMGFFQYEYNNSDPTEILTDVTKRLIGGSYGLLNERGKGVRRILFFPSCGVILPSPEVSKESASATIREHQDIADGIWSVKTGRRLSNTSKHMNADLKKKWGISGPSSSEFVGSYKAYRAAHGAAGSVNGSGGGGGGGGGGGPVEEGGRRRFRTTRKAKNRRRFRKSRRSNRSNSPSS